MRITLSYLLGSLLLLSSCFPKKQTAQDYKELAIEFEKRNKFKNAIKALQKASELDKKDPDIYVFMAEYYAFYLKQNYKNQRLILDTYNKAIHLNSWYEPVLISRAKYFYNISEYKYAIDELDSLLIRYPKNINAYLLEAKIYYEKKDTVTGNYVYNQALRNVSGKDIYKIYDEKAFREFNLKLYRSSINDYLHELRLIDGVQFTSYCQLSWAYLNINKKDSACYYYDLCSKKWYNHAGVDTDLLDKSCKGK